MTICVLLAVNYFVLFKEILVDRAVHAASARFLSSPQNDHYREDENPSLLKEDFTKAMAGFLPVAMRGISKASSDGKNVGWGDVGGLTETRNAIQEVNFISFLKYIVMDTFCPEIVHVLYVCSMAIVGKHIYGTYYLNLQHQNFSQYMFAWCDTAVQHFTTLYLWCYYLSINRPHFVLFTFLSLVSRLLNCRQSFPTYFHNHPLDSARTFCYMGPQVVEKRTLLGLLQLLQI
jgi:hypothetical protein